MKKVVVKAPAKVNLALAVTGLAENGYHTVDMLMQTVGLWERVEVVKSTGYSLRLPKSPIPPGEKNTATKSASAFFAYTGLLAGCDITIHKTIPTRAGLAGGSADAAAVLVGLNELYSAHLSMEELCEIGLTVGADVPFAILGGTARARGIGEDLTSLSPLPPCWFAIAMPKGGVSTPEAYRRFDTMGSPLSPDIDAACAAIQQGNLAALTPLMQNMLEHSNGNATTRLLRQTMDSHGALASMMTGSGAAVFGIFLDEPDARAACKAARRHASKVFCVVPSNEGAHVVESD